MAEQQCTAEDRRRIVESASRWRGFLLWLSHKLVGPSGSDHRLREEASAALRWAAGE